VMKDAKDKHGWAHKVSLASDKAQIKPKNQKLVQ
jgi:hypothetical protein